jgi:hypothetical protein
LRQYDLRWSGLPAMNPAAHLRHLYFQTKGFHPTKSGSLGLLKADQTTHTAEILLFDRSEPCGSVWSEIRFRDEEVPFKLRAVRRAKWNTPCWPVQDLHFLIADEFSDLEGKVLEVQRMLASLIQCLRSPILASCWELAARSSRR